MDDIKKLLGKRIKELRQMRGLSQLQLAELINIDQRNLSHIECGDTFPSKSLLELSSALDTKLNELFDFEHHELDISEMSDYIKNNIDKLTNNDVKTLYRMIKAMH